MAPSGAAGTVGGLTPFFIAADVARTLAFYRDGLGFSLLHAEGDPPHFAMIQREGAMLFLKSQAGIAPMPNPGRHASLRWDGFGFTPDPDALAAEFLGRGVLLSGPLKDWSDGLRGFEVTDPDGHVLFFGRPTG